ncbi:MAG: hypothetical protein JOZ57_00190 [Abitibacteriaceae bacterium]|nr:hypothetical protein [Abditibacteriaceae bacterium]
MRKECLGWGKYQPHDEPHLFVRVEAFLERYHYHRPHLAFMPMRPPLEPSEKLDRLDRTDAT